MDPANSRIRLRPEVLATVMLALAAGVCVFLYWPEVKTLLTGVCENVFGGPVCQSDMARSLIGGYLFSILALPLALMLEMLIPARRDQSLVSSGFRQDVAWWLFDGAFSVTLLAGFSLLLYNFFDGFLSFARIDVITSLPKIPQIIAVVLLSDFLAWFHHWVRHKVPLFWQFHKVHHSQREMNYFSDSRIHPFDTFFAQLIRFIPFYSLELNLAVPAFVGWRLFTLWYTRIYHANIRTNLGVLRYVLVTPQSHRVHHSTDVGHRDMNFGVIFSVWDFIFGTQYRGYDEYPETGVDDVAFPVERDTALSQILGTLWRQLVYPFTSVIRRG